MNTTCNRVLHSPDDFQNLIGTSFSKFHIRQNFHDDAISSYYLYMQLVIEVLPGFGRSLCRWLPRSNGNFYIPRFISGKMFMEIWSAVIIWSDTSIAGRDFCSTGDFQIVMEISLSQGISLVKFLWRHDQQLLSGEVCPCWCLAEVCKLWMISKMWWGLSWP